MAVSLSHRRPESGAEASVPAAVSDDSATQFERVMKKLALLEDELARSGHRVALAHNTYRTQSRSCDVQANVLGQPPKNFAVQPEPRLNRFGTTAHPDLPSQPAVPDLSNQQRASAKPLWVPPSRNNSRQQQQQIPIENQPIDQISHRSINGQSINRSISENDQIRSPPPRPPRPLERFAKQSSVALATDPRNKVELSEFSSTNSDPLMIQRSNESPIGIPTQLTKFVNLVQNKDSIFSRAAANNGHRKQLSLDSDYYGGSGEAAHDPLNRENRGFSEPDPSCGRFQPHSAYSNFIKPYQENMELQYAEAEFPVHVKPSQFASSNRTSMYEDVSGTVGRRESKNCLFSSLPKNGNEPPLPPRRLRSASNTATAYQSPIKACSNENEPWKCSNGSPSSNKGLRSIASAADPKHYEPLYHSNSTPGYVIQSQPPVGRDEFNSRNHIRRASVDQPLFGGSTVLDRLQRGRSHDDFSKAVGMWQEVAKRASGCPTWLDESKPDNCSTSIGNSDRHRFVELTPDRHVPLPRPPLPRTRSNISVDEVTFREEPRFRKLSTSSMQHPTTSATSLAHPGNRRQKVPTFDDYDEYDEDIKLKLQALKNNVSNKNNKSQSNDAKKRELVELCLKGAADLLLSLNNNDKNAKKSKWKKAGDWFKQNTFSDGQQGENSEVKERKKSPVTKAVKKIKRTLSAASENADSFHEFAEDLASSVSLDDILDHL